MSYYVPPPSSWWDTASIEEVQAERAKAESVLRDARDRYEGARKGETGPSRMRPDLSESTFKKGPLTFTSLRDALEDSEEPEEDIEEKAIAKAMRERRTKAQAQDLIDRWLDRIKSKGG